MSRPSGNREGSSSLPIGGARQRLLTSKDAAAYLGVSPRTLWALESRSQILAVRFGAGSRKSVRFDIRDLDRWIEAGKKGRR